MSRPFYSIVIPCWNSGRTIGDLLQSIVDQEMEKDQIQVILADDCSTEPYMDKVEPFVNRLNIVYTKTQYNCCPGNTREAGAQVATGTWMCFADHDDIFIPGALKSLKEIIEGEEARGEKKIDSMISTTFLHVDPYNDDAIMQVHGGDDPSKGWTHGNFYNVDNLWRKYDIHYKKDMKSHEDIYLFSVINALKDIHQFYTLMVPDLVTYKWRCWIGSESNKRIEVDGVERAFLEVYFKDYAEATGGVYRDMLLKYPDKVNGVLRECLITAYAWYYFYVESFIFEHKENYLTDNIDYLVNWVEDSYNKFGVTIEEVWQYLCNNVDTWFSIQQRSFIATGPVIDVHNFLEFWQGIRARQRLSSKMV